MSNAGIVHVQNSQSILKIRCLSTVHLPFFVYGAGVRSARFFGPLATAVFTVTRDTKLRYLGLTLGSSMRGWQRGC